MLLTVRFNYVNVMVFDRLVDEKIYSVDPGG